MAKEIYPMCARRLCKCTNPRQEDSFLRELLQKTWRKGLFISGFYEENDSVYIFWPRELKDEFWNIPVDTGDPFYIDFNDKMNEVNLFWIVEYFPNKDPIPQPFCKDESLIKFD